jgi:hypothetical protein
MAVLAVPPAQKSVGKTMKELGLELNSERMVSTQAAAGTFHWSGVNCPFS